MTETKNTSINEPSTICSLQAISLAELTQIEYFEHLPMVS